jgi:hypothetical protein
MLKNLLCFIILSALLVACAAGAKEEKKSGKLNGLQKFYYPDGELYIEGTYKDSLANGVFKQYLKNGNVYEESHYVNGVQYGVTKRYYEDGKLELEIPYDSGRVHGIQKKYRRDGKLAYEAPYHFGEPCKGLKEYYTSGKLVDKIPEIIVKVEDHMWEDNRYSLRLSVPGARDVKFFTGSLTDGKYIGNKAERVYMERDDTGRIDYMVAPGMIVMEGINIIAKVKSDLNNYYIIEKRYNVAVQNR